MRASADVDVTRSDSLFVVRKSASPRRFDLLTHREGRGIGRRLTAGVDPCSREAHAPQDNCVHKSCINYGNLRCHFQDRASASIHICPAVRGHLPGGLWCRYWPDSGDFRELRASIGPQCLRRNGFNRGSSNLVGERIELGVIDNDRQIPQPARGRLAFHLLSRLSRAREGRGADDGAGGRREVGGGARRQSVQVGGIAGFKKLNDAMPIVDSSDFKQPHRSVVLLSIAGSLHWDAPASLRTKLEEPRTPPAPADPRARQRSNRR